MEKMKKEQKERIIGFFTNVKERVVEKLKHSDFACFDDKGDIRDDIYIYIDSLLPVYYEDYLKWGLENISEVNRGIEEFGSQHNVFEDLKNAMYATYYEEVCEELEDIKYLTNIINLINYIKNDNLRNLSENEEENLYSLFDNWNLDYDCMYEWKDLNNFENLEELIEEEIEE